jgi:saccharopine dehydrogenase-like NADP-dependent oxidoreductase
MKAAIFGIGRMGKAIAFAMRKQGFEVVGVDSRPAAHELLDEIIPEGDYTFYHTENLSGDIDGMLSFEDPDVVISSLPYHQNSFLARYCIVNKIRYCDLGGSVPVSKEINDYAKIKAEKPIITDLGLAPGWVNILAEWGYSEIRGVPEKISMMVGGLPVSQENPPLDYVVTWSIDGLINEYRDDCEILKDGKILKVKGMDGYEKVFIDWIGKKMEAFYTSGGASHTTKDMKE